MAVLTPKDKAELAYIFELTEFRSFKKLCVYLKDRATKLMVAQNMAEPGADKAIALLQGQIYALDKIIDQWRSYHKQEIDKAIKDKR